jgi:Tol biopolymer transport system component
MIKKIIYIILVVSLVAGTLYSQTTYFGKNKVQYRTFDWQFIQSRHFDIYFYELEYESAKFAASVLESAYVDVSEQLNYMVHKRVPVFIYNSHNDFQQTNIIGNLIGEGTGGFTEAAKNRIVIPHNGSLEDFRHVLHHELTHAVVYDMLLGNLFTSLLSRRRLFDLPLWYAEGYAEYSARPRWHTRTDMIVRDATINNYLQPPDYVYGGMEYYQGTAMVNYIVDQYGTEKLGEILKKGKVQLTMNKALKASIGIGYEEFWKSFSKEMKRRYWPEISKRKDTEEIAKRLTNHMKDPSNLNEKPVFSPVGDFLAIFSDRSDYTEIYLISAIDGRILDRLVKGHRSGDLESLHSYLSGISFSPDGEKMAFVSKSKGNDNLYFLDMDSKDIYKRVRLDFGSVLSPVWSPDGTKIAMSVLDGRHRDIVIYDVSGDTTYHLAQDIYDDMDPHWFPDSKRLVFSSDRPHPDNDFILATPDSLASDSLNWWAIYHKGKYGNYSLFTIDVETGGIAPIPCGPGQNTEPVVSPDGNRICFVSNRNGINNLYITEIESTSTFAITDILTGTFSPSWSPDGKKIAFSAFGNAGQDVYLLQDITPAGDNGVLEPTGYVLGLYHNAYETTEDEDSEEESTPEQADTLLSHINLLASKDKQAKDSSETEEDDPIEIADGSNESDTTRIEDGEYIHVGEDTDFTDDQDRLDRLFVAVNDSAGMNTLSPKEQAAFDSVANNNRLPSGEYKVHNYRVKFTPDFVSGGFSYDTFFGLRGQSIFAFSDYTGDHQIYLLTDLVNTIDQSNIQMYYFYNRMKMNMGVGVFHTKNFYIDAFDHLFSDRLYGFQGYFSLPFSQFFRAELLASQYFIDRKFHDSNDLRENRSTRTTTGTFSLVQDNILWGVTGPLNGRRSRLDISAAFDIFGGENISFLAMEFDYRKYWHHRGLFSTALRLSAGVSRGDSPKRYFLGGTSNYIGNTVVDAQVYDEESLYFASVVTPLRGYDYYELFGTRYFLANLEFRYPFVDYLQMNFPLPLSVRYVTGAIFYDMGAAWSNDDAFKGITEGHFQDIKASFGFGIRANLGIFVLRYDLAWRTDFRTVADHPRYYFSLGADF